MKSLPKFLIIFFLTIFIIQLICLFFILAVPAAGRAAGVQYTPQVALPDYTFNPQDTSTGNIARYIRAIYKYAIGVVGIVAAVVLMIGGVMWIVAGGNATAIGEAKAWIAASLTGLVLALTSYLILATVNPALVDFQLTGIKNVKNINLSTGDQTITCGQQLPGAEGVCGKMCPNGQTCQKVVEGTVGAKNCVFGSDDWWLCSSIISGGSTSCCTGNIDTQCSSGYICNMQMITGGCAGKGTCALKQSINGICGENNDCASNNCNTGFLATNKCE